MCNRSSHLRCFLPPPSLISEQIAIKHQTLSFTTFSSSTVIQFLVARFRSDHSAEWTKLEKRKPDYNFLHDCHITFSIFFFPPDLSRAINWREGAREMRNKMKKKLSSAGGPSGRACWAALKMSIIDPRKGNEIQRPNIKKIFVDSFFAILSLAGVVFSPSPSITFSCLGYSTRNHPFLNLALASTENQQEKRLSSHHPQRARRRRKKNAKPSFRMWICGCLVEGDVITISIRTLFLLS